MTVPTAPDQPSGSHDFDFFFGSWHILNERLRSRLSGSSDWETFEAKVTCRPILRGMGNIDDFRPEWPGHEGYEGGTLRLFNPSTREWSLYWMDSISGQLQRPVVGRFVDGVGEFFGPDTHDGRDVLLRFRWYDITGDAATWNQALSEDGGVTWETNWIMQMTWQGTE